MSLHTDDLDAGLEALDAELATMAWRRALVIRDYQARFGGGRIGHADMVRHLKRRGLTNSEITRLEHWLEVAASDERAQQLGSASKADAAWRLTKRGILPGSEAVTFCLSHTARECERAAAGGVDRKS